YRATPADRCHIKPVCLVRSASRSARAISGATHSQFQKTSLIKRSLILERRTRLLQVTRVTGNPSEGPRARAREGVGVLDAAASAAGDGVAVAATRRRYANSLPLIQRVAATSL